LAGVKDTPLSNMGFQQIVNPAASTALTVPTGSRYALFNCSAGTIVWRDDGTAPTATIGIIMNPLTGAVQNYWYTGELAAVRVIQATSGTLNVSYYA